MILASSSKQRKELLSEYGCDFEVLAVETDEVFDEKRTIYENIVDVAYNKAIATINRYDIVSNVVIAADTIVYCNNRILLKPKNLDDAISMLNLYKNNIVHVISGVSVIEIDKDGNKKVNNFYDESEVIFSNLTDQEITKWLNLNEYKYCSGALKIEYSLKHMDVDIVGSISNITGLPMEKLTKLIKTTQ